VFVHGPVMSRLRPTSATEPPLSRLGLWVALGASMVVVLDFSIVNVALPALSTELGLPTTTAEWVVTAYALTFGGLLILGGRAADYFGHRRVLITGLGVFALASAAGGLAPDFALLVAARALQGAAAALIAPAALSTLTTTYPEGPARNRVLGYFGVTASLGFVVGLVAGGVLVDTVGWRGVFFVNVPVCVAMAIAAHTSIPTHGHAATGPRLDLAGAALAGLGMAALVYSPTLAAHDGWLSVEFVVCLLLGAALIYAFVRIERRTAHPLVPLSIFRHRSLVVGDVLTGLVGAWVASEVLVLSLYGQQVLGYSPLITGLIAVPQGIGGILRGIAGPRLLDRVGLKHFLVGNCLLAAASLALLLRTPATTHYPLLGVALLAVGFGSTNIIFGSAVAGSAGVANDEQGLASALLNATRQVGAAVGVAAMLSIVATDMTGQTNKAGMASGYRMALLVSGGLAVLGALVSLRLPAKGSVEADHQGPPTSRRRRARRRSVAAARRSGQVGGGHREPRRPDVRRQGLVSTSVNPSRSSTVTVSAEWPLRLSGDGTFSWKWMHTPACAFVPNVSPSSFIEPRAPAAVHQR
jgi:EmrB/QacA subfamily drug resistance transporter